MTFRSKCSVEGCNHYGKRLLRSMKCSYKLKADYSGKVCETCYRKSLRIYHKINSHSYDKFNEMCKIILKHEGLIQ